MRDVRRIGVPMDLVGSYHRGIFLGLRQYAEEAGNWHCQFCSNWLDRDDSEIAKWKVDGWIGYGTEPTLLAAIRVRPRPVVSVSSYAISDGRPLVVSDNKAVGKLAFEYLLDRGHTNFAFVCPHKPFRHEGFVHAVEEFGRPCHQFNLKANQFPSHAEKELRKWLSNLPKPIGVFADNDIIGAFVLDCCREEHLAVPEAVAVLSVDNDELYCTARIPTLSSIQLDTFRIGYEAAATLDRILNGDPPPQKALLIPPLHVVTRQSTDALSFADDEVRRAVSFIRSRITQPTTVADVLQQATVSAATLENRFRRQLKTSILRYIHKVHVEHAMSLLLSPDLSIAEVARRSGFTSPTRMGIVFRQVAGRTPGEHRRQARRAARLYEPPRASA